MSRKMEVLFKDQSEKSELSDCTTFGLDQAKKAITFHRSFPEYQPTPLVELKELSKQFGVDQIFVKDESCRFSLNAFKVLGGSYCIGNYIAKRLGVDISALTYDKITDPETRKKLGDVTFVTATDGNHGQQIVWGRKV